MPDLKQFPESSPTSPSIPLDPLQPPTYLKLYHNEFASVFDQRRPFCPELGDRICSIGDLKPGKRYLDICSGTGLYAQHPVLTGAEVTCLEPDEGLINQARLKFGERAKYVQSPAQSYKPQVRFDAAGIVNGIHVLLKLGQAEAVMRRIREDILLPNGSIVMAFCDRKDMQQQPHVQFFQREMEQIAFKSADTVREFLENTVPTLGYSLITQESVPTTVKANTAWLTNFIQDRSTSTLQKICTDLGPERWQRRVEEIAQVEIPNRYPSGEIEYSYSITLFAFKITA